jgi:hypothetical protein
MQMALLEQLYEEIKQVAAETISSAPTRQKK